jgi:hypothetical protein
MQRKVRTVHRRDAGQVTGIHAANFYALPFASQMMVWAMRKRLNAIRIGDRGADDVLHVFHMADWGALYESLLALVDILVGTLGHDALVLHAPRCPALAGHEVHILNAVAYVQDGRTEEATRCLTQLIPPTALRLAIPHLRTIAEQVRAQCLKFVYVDATNVEPRACIPIASARALHHVH